MARLTMDEIVDRAEITDVFARYCHQHDVLAARLASGEADGTEFDVFDTIFTPDAILDFTKTGGPRAGVKPVAEWMAKAYSLFPAQQHLLGQTQFEFAADRDSVTTLTWVINPMAFGTVGGPLQVFMLGGFYRDRLIRTGDGWRIVERVFDQQWSMGDMPADLVLPEFESAAV